MQQYTLRCQKKRLCVVGVHACVSATREVGLGLHIFFSFFSLFLFLFAFFSYPSSLIVVPIFLSVFSPCFFLFYVWHIGVANKSSHTRFYEGVRQVEGRKRCGWVEAVLSSISSKSQDFPDKGKKIPARNLHYLYKYFCLFHASLLYLSSVYWLVN